MKIYATWQNFGGVEYHRLYQPLKRIAEAGIAEVVQTDSFAPEHMEDCDLLIFSRTLGPYTGKILRAMQKLKKPVIVDVDDLWNLPAKHVSSRFYRQNNIDRQILDAIKLSWGVTTTNSVLSAEISSHNRNIMILPNAIDLTDEQWTKTKTHQGDRLRFGYVGGLTHLDDTALLWEPTKRILDEYPDKVQFVICGYNGEGVEKEIWQGMISNLTGGGRARGEQIAVAPSAHPCDYGEFYAHFDVALAPLEGGLFNRCKSDLKVIEAAAYRCPIIASCIHPYTAHRHNSGVRLCNSSEDWYNAMRFHIEHPELIQQAGNANFVFCDEQRNFDVINRNRARFYQQAFEWMKSKRVQPA